MNEQMMQVFLTICDDLFDGLRLSDGLVYNCKRKIDSFVGLLKLYCHSLLPLRRWVDEVVDKSDFAVNRSEFFKRNIRNEF